MTTVRGFPANKWMIDQPGTNLASATYFCFPTEIEAPTVVRRVKIALPIPLFNEVFVPEY
jgi:hypothetical protein